jgi:hypothetical protein
MAPNVDPKSVGLAAGTLIGACFSSRGSYWIQAAVGQPGEGPNQGKVCGVSGNWVLPSTKFPTVNDNAGNNSPIKMDAVTCHAQHPGYIFGTDFDGNDVCLPNTTVNQTMLSVASPCKPGKGKLNGKDVYITCKLNGAVESYTFCSTANGFDANGKCISPQPVVVNQSGTIPVATTNAPNAGRECGSSVASKDSTGNYIGTPSCDQICDRNSDGKFNSKQVNGKVVCDVPSTASTNNQAANTGSDLSVPVPTNVAPHAGTSCGSDCSQVCDKNSAGVWASKPSTNGIVCDVPPTVNSSSQLGTHVGHAAVGAVTGAGACVGAALLATPFIGPFSAPIAAVCGGVGIFGGILGFNTP